MVKLKLLQVWLLLPLQLLLLVLSLVHVACLFLRRLERRGIALSQTERGKHCSTCARRRCTVFYNENRKSLKTCNVLNKQAR